MESVTKLHRLSGLESTVIDLLRLLGETEQEFFAKLLEAQVKAIEQPDNVVRLRTG